MRKRTFTAIINALALAACATLQPPAAAAQEAGGTVSLSNQSGRISVKLERGSRVSISNRYGRITITGWDRDTVEASATSSKGAEAVQVSMTADPQSRSTLALAVVGRRGAGGGTIYYPAPAAPPARPSPTSNPAPAPGPRGEGRERERQEVKDKIKEAAKNGVILVPMPSVVVQTPGVTIQAPQGTQPATAKQPTPGARGAGGGSGTVVGAARAGGEDSGITLDVKVPRYAQLDAIEVRAGALNVSGIDGPVSVVSGSSDINVSHVGSLELRARGGNVNVEDVGGLVYVVSTSSEINVRRSSGDVRVTTINGNIGVECVKGRVDAGTSRGKITLTNVGGDVEATTTDSDINFTGSIAQNGRYRLKSMEGHVIMAIPDGSPGFTANLMSYNSDAVSDFVVRASTPRPDSQAMRRVEVRQGDGQAQITLDSFSQTVRLSKLAPGAAPACR
ncbi:MAG TPA: DUF4097 family beta strand repeat-containing protein [Pyrinomonadaceae bacterium]|nr:DUF4097 family beta strand repeat-containing protein [Pyrinomonadaceae bacterium]